MIVGMFRRWSRRTAGQDVQGLAQGHGEECGGPQEKSIQTQEPSNRTGRLLQDSWNRLIAEQIPALKFVNTVK